MRQVITLDIGGTYLKYGIVSEAGSILQQEKQRTRKTDGTDLLAQVHEIITLLLHVSSNIDGIGISTAGQVDTMTGKIVYATETLPGWTGTLLKQSIEEKFSLPCFVENDVNAAALGELHFGSHRNENDFLCLTYGTGIGGSIIHHRQLVRGSNGCAGEFGHIIIQHNGRECTCGGKGCYEQYASVGALVREAKKQFPLLDVDIGAEWLFDQYDKDMAITSFLNTYIDYVTTGLRSLIYIFNPTLIIIGGGISSHPLFLEKINERLNPQLIPSFSPNLRIVPASLQNDAALLGVASYFLTEYKVR